MVNEGHTATSYPKPAAGSSSPVVMSPSPVKVMISYRKDDCADQPRGDGSANRWKAALEKQGWEVFLDQIEIEAGDFWEENIIHAVESCHVLVALISTHYADSPWCKGELKLATDKGKLIIPVFHSGEYPPHDLVLRLGSVQSIPAGAPMRVADFDMVVDKVVTSIKRKLKVEGGEKAVQELR